MTKGLVLWTDVGNAMFFFNLMCFLHIFHNRRQYEFREEKEKQRKDCSIQRYESVKSVSCSVVSDSATP